MNATAKNNIASTISQLQFEMIKTHIDDSEQMSYTTYGIQVRDSQGNSILAYPDISTSKGLVQGFIDMVKDRDIAAIHIGDLLDDYLE